MGWRVAHHRRKRFERRCSSNKFHNQKRRSSRETNSQQLITRLLMEANGAVEVGALEHIFGLASPHDALRVALRIKQLKKREDAFFSNKKISVHTLFPRRLRARENKKDKKVRDVHHLTPQCREDGPFYGDNRHNFLLIKIARHEALHEAFGVRTWEEIIVILSRCVAAVRHMDFNVTIDLVQRAFKRPQRRKARRALRNLQLGFCPGIYSGVFLVGPQGIEPCLPAPKAGVLPVYDGPSRPFKVSYF